MYGTEALETSPPAYAECLVAASTEDGGFGVTPTGANVFDLVPLPSSDGEELLLAAATCPDDHDLTPFDAVHAADAATRHEGALVGPDRAHDGPSDLNRRPLTPDRSGRLVSLGGGRVIRSGERVGRVASY